MKLNDLRDNEGATKARMRVGRVDRVLHDFLDRRAHLLSIDHRRRDLTQRDVNLPIGHI